MLLPQMSQKKPFIAELHIAPFASDVNSLRHQRLGNKESTALFIFHGDKFFRPCLVYRRGGQNPFSKELIGPPFHGVNEVPLSSRLPSNVTQCDTHRVPLPYACALSKATYSTTRIPSPAVRAAVATFKVIFRARVS